MAEDLNQPSTRTRVRICQLSRHCRRRVIGRSITYVNITSSARAKRIVMNSSPLSSSVFAQTSPISSSSSGIHYAGCHDMASYCGEVRTMPQDMVPSPTPLKRCCKKCQLGLPRGYLLLVWHGARALYHSPGPSTEPAMNGPSGFHDARSSTSRSLSSRILHAQRCQRRTASWYRYFAIQGLCVLLLSLPGPSSPSHAQVTPPPPITSTGLHTQVNLSATPPAGMVQHDITGGTRPGG